MSETPAKHPVVFISYSHDSKDHKIWVLELAQELRRDHGIEIILDQWDIEYGDDVPKFMQRAIGKADRVLMICTDIYVQKADDGKGGAGYEAMIVDGELVNDLGIRKFIPIIRQSPGEIRLPKCVGTRLAVNLSEGSDRMEELEKLVTSIHRIPPSTKPPIGKAPRSPSLAKVAPPSRIVNEYSDDPGTLYEEALALAQSEDIVTWRRLIGEKKRGIGEPLTAWREKWESQLPTRKDELPAYNLEGMKAFEPLFAVALAGVESGKPRFNSHSGLIHDLLDIEGWDDYGQRLTAALPETSAFLFHALHGTIAVYSDQVDLAIAMAKLRIRLLTYESSAPLVELREMTGYPTTLDGNAKIAWQFLWDIPNHWKWIADKLGGQRSFHQCLCGYYFLLSWMEYLDVIRSKNTGLLTEERILRLAVPTTYLTHDEHRAGLSKVLAGKHALIDHSTRIGVSLQAQAEHWGAWTQVSHRWASAAHRIFRTANTSELDHFIEDMGK